MPLSRHEQKRMKKTIKALMYWRSKVMSALHAMNRSRINVDYKERIATARVAVKNSKKTINRIDYLLGEAHLMLKIDMPELEAVPSVRIKTYKPKPYVPPKRKKGEGSYISTPFTVR